MIYLLPVAGFLVAAAFTALLVPLVRRLAHWNGWFDKPDAKRKLHKDATPAIGGIAIAIGVAAGVLFLLAVQDELPFALRWPPTALWIGGLLMVCAGFYDDTRGLGFKLKFVLQVVAAYMLVHAGYRIEISGLSFIEAEGFNQALSSLLTMVWIVGIINAVNLIDGLDGLAAGVVFIAFACLTVVFGVQGEVMLVIFPLLIMGALSGFLIYNFNPASIFMGDSGSLFLGFLLASYSLEGKAHTDPWFALLVPVVALGFPLLDTSLAVARRAIRRQRIFMPDSDHIHHRLTRRWSHRKAVLVLYAVELWFGSAAILMVFTPPVVGYIVLGMTLTSTYLGLSMLGYLRLFVPLPPAPGLSYGTAHIRSDLRHYDLHNYDHDPSLTPADAPPTQVEPPAQTVHPEPSVLLAAIDSNGYTLRPEGRIGREEIADAPVRSGQ